MRENVNRPVNIPLSLCLERGNNESKHKGIVTTSDLSDDSLACSSK